MGTVVDKIQYTLTAVNDIVDALTEKGFDIEHLYNINDYGRLIRQIKGGTGSDVKIYGGMEAVKLEYIDTNNFTSLLLDCPRIGINKDEMEIIYNETEFIETKDIITEIVTMEKLKIIETFNRTSSLIDIVAINSLSTEFGKMINMSTEYINTKDSKSGIDTLTLEKTNTLNTALIPTSILVAFEFMEDYAGTITTDYVLTNDKLSTIEYYQIKKDFMNIFLEYYLYTNEKVNKEFIDYLTIIKNGFETEYIDTTKTISDFADYIQITLE